MIKPVKGLKFASGMFLVLSLVFIMTAYYDYYDNHFNKKAIVLTETISVRSGLTDDSTELFVLHEGTKVGVDDELRGYVKIHFSDDKIGWVKKKDIEII
jgi:uncharacterized protein YgiM (DUF1202 family)